MAVSTELDRSDTAMPPQHPNHGGMCAVTSMSVTTTRTIKPGCSRRTNPTGPGLERTYSGGVCAGAVQSPKISAPFAHRWGTFTTNSPAAALLTCAY